MDLKHFIWLAMHGNLSTNAFRAGRHLSSDSSCKRRGASIESLLHTFRDCPLSLAIWDAILFNKDTNFNSQNFIWWFKHYALDPNANIFIITCWVLWKARNEKVFNGNDWVNWVCLGHIYYLHSKWWCTFLMMQLRSPLDRLNGFLL